MFEFFVRFSLGFLLVFMALFLIALVLIQRGRGGGLAGAFGGAGGQSAFGTKAGDMFTRITVVVAFGWILLCILASNVLSTQTSRLSPTLGGAAGQRVQTEPAPSEIDAAATAEKPPASKPQGENKPDGEKNSVGENPPPATASQSTDGATNGAETKGDAPPASGNETPQADAVGNPAPSAGPVTDSPAGGASSPADTSAAPAAK